tara:strand:- start:902 stop:1111 length:210 start_codon:yes stop_codon:yes gene_type:complete
MYTQKENLESVQRDREILKLMNGLQDNLISCKEIIDLLTTRIEKLEKNKLDKPKEGYVVKTEKVELFDE